jgi:hypothetical protein
MICFESKTDPAARAYLIRHADRLSKLFSHLFGKSRRNRSRWPFSPVQHLPNLLAA